MRRCASDCGLLVGSDSCWQSPKLRIWQVWLVRFSLSIIYIEVFMLGIITDHAMR